MQTVKKVVVPTDFSVKSLSLVVEIIERTIDAPLEIVLVHGIYPSDSITDLLFTSKSKLLHGLQTAEFTEACTLIKNKYQSRIKALYVDVLTSNSRSYLEGYLLSTRVETVYLPTSYKLRLSNNRSFDLCAALKRVPANKVELQIPEQMVHHSIPSGQVTDLFFARL